MQNALLSKWGCLKINTPEIHVVYSYSNWQLLVNVVYPTLKKWATPIVETHKLQVRRG